MQESLERVPLENILRGWLVIRPDKRGELSCHLNLSLCKLFFVHSFSSDSEKAIMMNKKSTDVILSPCLTPTLKGIATSIFPIIDLTTLFLYIHTIADCRLGRHPYFPRIQTISL